MRTVKILKKFNYRLWRLIGQGAPQEEINKVKQQRDRVAILENYTNGPLAGERASLKCCLFVKAGK